MPKNLSEEELKWLETEQGEMKFRAAFEIRRQRKLLNNIALNLPKGEEQQLTLGQAQFKLRVIGDLIRLEGQR